jgi:hypothetical protein
MAYIREAVATDDDDDDDTAAGRRAPSAERRAPSAEWMPFSSGLTSRIPAFLQQARKPELRAARPRARRPGWVRHGGSASSQAMPAFCLCFDAKLPRPLGSSPLRHPLPHLP